MFIFCISYKEQNKIDLPTDDAKSKTKDVISSNGPDSITRLPKSSSIELKTIGTKRAKVNKTQLTENGNLWFGTTAHFDAEKGVKIQNSLPKGGSYTDPTGKKFGYAIFWTRVINETATPLELTVSFPADSFAIFPQPDSYLKLFLPPDKMTLDKESLPYYGATGLKYFMDTGLNKPTMLQRTIQPKEECLFYIGMLFHVPDNGSVRTGLVLKEQDLFYRISMVKQLDSALIPCGHIIFKK